MKSIAIIGAGMAGLTIAKRLKKYAKVTIFEKSRGVGGRMATRRAGAFQFDHGAQFFRARTDAFAGLIQTMLEQGVAKRWDARFVELSANQVISERAWDESNPHYVGVPGMNAVGKYLSQGLDIHFRVRVTCLKQGQGWEILDEQGHAWGSYDWVVVAVPSAQAIDLLPKHFQFYSTIQTAQMSGCFSLMLGFADPLPLAFDVALVRNADISWISVNSSKPDTGSNYCLLVNSTNKWANANLDRDKTQVIEYLCQELSKIIGFSVDAAPHKDIHLWRYANIHKQSFGQALLDKQLQLAVCGDWCIEGRVEAAFSSGLGLANQMLEML